MLGASFPAVAAHLVTAEADARIEYAVAIYPDRACLDALRDPVRSRYVPGPDAAREAVRRIVREPQRILHVVERNDRDHRTEDLLARDRHVIAHVRENGRLDEVALRQLTA